MSPVSFSQRLPVLSLVSGTSLHSSLVRVASSSGIVSVQVRVLLPVTSWWSRVIGLVERSRMEAPHGHLTERWASSERSSGAHTLIVVKWRAVGSRGVWWTMIVARLLVLRSFRLFLLFPVLQVGLQVLPWPSPPFKLMGLVLVMGVSPLLPQVPSFLLRVLSLSAEMK